MEHETELNGKSNGDCLSNALAGILITAARDTSPVSGLTHNHYRYPARFSPRFVRVVIEQFTEPGDLILDPFMGGGTTLVEALALGRRAIGTDISSLAAFVAETKTLLLSDADVLKLRTWIKQIAHRIHMHRQSVGSFWWEENGYQKNLSSPQTWRLRKAIEQALLSAATLRPMHLEQFARCVILRTAQWAIDGRKTMPTVRQFRDHLVEFSGDMISGSLELRMSATKSSNGTRIPAIICAHRSATGIEKVGAFSSQPPPKLVLTSPPYPGVHMLYHRWQVLGGKETPAPFWIANKLDGAGEKYYSLGHRKENSLRSYFANLESAFSSVRRLCNSSTNVVQMVAFSNPDWQLPKYLEVMKKAGFAEVQLPSIGDSDDGRLWREVPNRRWHAGQKGSTPGSREVVLIHKPIFQVMQPLRRSRKDNLCPPPAR